MSLEGLNRLKVWVKAKEFAVSIYKKVLPLLPSEEKWNLNQQLRRSALSVPANIAEGYGRSCYQDNVRFCYNARGSLDDVLSHLTIAYELNYISEGYTENS
jgi:four helix bundle protein